MFLEKADSTLINKDIIALFLESLSRHVSLKEETLKRHLMNSSRFSEPSWQILRHILINSDLCSFNHENASFNISTGILAQREIETFMASSDFFRHIFGAFSRSINLDEVFIDESTHVIGGDLYINRSKIPKKFLNLVHWLKSLDFFEYTNYYEDNLKIRPEYQSFFKTEILLESNAKFNIPISLEEFKKIQSKKEENGHKAEEFVLEFEKNEIKDIKKQRQIRRVSLTDVGAGYDIISFLSDNSVQPDKYIEVKSYSGKKPEFYITAKELRAASEYKSNYYIYLVDIHKIENSGYQPLRINDPIANIYNSPQWLKSEESYHFIKNL